MSTASTLHRSAPDTAHVHGLTPWHAVLGLAVALSAALAVLLSVFAWPATETRPRDVPIAVAGPPEAVDRLRAALNAAQPGAFSIRSADGLDEARALVRDRDVDGALLLSPEGPSVIVATQAGPAIAQALTQVVQAVAGTTVPVEDVAPASPDDPRGTGLAAGALPLALIGGAAGGLLFLRVHGPARRSAGAVLFGLLAGPTAVGILHGWLGALTGDPLAEVAVVGLGLAATTLGILGIATVAGRIGLVLAELLVVAVGNPLSGASSAPALLPDGWAALGQSLPPGALVAALRAVSGFDGTGAGRPLTVLTFWAAGGLLLLALQSFHERHPARPHTLQS
ncbi:hypothetical protein [Blastococcus deserti]|uniref:ABC transporter permease n=1 Tax=Blastococcus deserti TaxID=2259033 RepID=A0ABW4XCL8_9ACTN